MKLRLCLLSPSYRRWPERWFLGLTSLWRARRYRWRTQKCAPLRTQSHRPDAADPRSPAPPLSVLYSCGAPCLSLSENYNTLYRHFQLYFISAIRNNLRLKTGRDLFTQQSTLFCHFISEFNFIYKLFLLKLLYLSEAVKHKKEWTGSQHCQS